jgi:hypothetical protein
VVDKDGLGRMLDMYLFLEAREFVMKSLFIELYIFVPCG